MRRATAFGTILASLAWTAAAPGQLVTISFDELTPGPILMDQYAAQGVSMRLVSAPGPYGNGELIASPAVSHSLPPPASGIVISPYANFAGFLGPFQFTFSTPLEFFSLDAIGPQAFMAQAFFESALVQTLVVPADPLRVSYPIELGGLPSPQVITRVQITPSGNLPFPLDPNTGPGFYDNLSFRPIPEPLACGWLVAIAGLGSRGRRWRFG